MLRDQIPPIVHDIALIILYSNSSDIAISLLALKSVCCIWNGSLVW